MGFQDKITRVCASADREAERLLGRHTRDIATLVAAVLKSGRWADLPIKTQNHLGTAAGDALAAADLADAADFIHERVLKAANGLIIDLKLSVDLRRAQDQILALFAEGGAPRRGFVYVAWSLRPETYLYVGKAGNVNRLSLASHGKLARATAHATTLSLLFPSQSRDETLRGVEAAVLRLLQFATGGYPELNEREESVPHGSGSGQLDSLSDFFTSMAAIVNPYDEY